MELAGAGLTGEVGGTEPDRRMWQPMVQGAPPGGRRSAGAGVHAEGRAGRGRQAIGCDGQGGGLRGGCEGTGAAAGVTPKVEEASREVVRLCPLPAWTAGRVARP